MAAPNKSQSLILALRALKHITHSAIFLLVSLFTYHCALGVTLASSGLISQVGGATFIQGAKQFWVTSARPTFSGVTTADTAVSGTVGTQTVSATANASGNWSWTPIADLAGDNTVTITSGSQTVSFKLTIGSLPASIASASASTLAPAGTMTPTLIVLGFGIILTAFSLWGLRKSFLKS